MKSHENIRRVPAGALTILTAMSAVGAALVFTSSIQAENEHEVTTFTVDVAQDAKTNMQNDVNPAEGQDVFSRGDTFILSGNIYRAGTLPSGKANNDPNAPGAIGTYRMQGTYWTDTAKFRTGHRWFARRSASDGCGNRNIFITG